MYLLDFRTWIRNKWKIHPNFGAMMDYFQCNSNTHSVMGVWVKVSNVREYSNGKPVGPLQLKEGSED